MLLAGVEVPDGLVATLADMLRDAGLDYTAGILDNAYELETKVLSLSMPARDELLQVLVDCPDDFCELRTVLLQQKEWPQEGITLVSKSRWPRPC